MSAPRSLRAPAAAPAAQTAPLLEVRALVKHFPAGKGLFSGHEVVHALDGIDLDVRPGEVLGVVGESGSGKSTLARCMLRLLEPTSGSILFAGQDVTRIRGSQLAHFRQRVQPVFQDPLSSLDPRWRVGQSVREALDALAIGSRQERRRRVHDLLDRVGLSRALAERRPHELSGGQRQRVGIAAALAPEPDLIVADEPVSALDVSVQAQVLNLLAELQRDLGLAIVLIAHDLSVVEHLCHRVGVMYLGKLAELGATEQVFGRPRHPYTRALLEAIPYPNPSRRSRPTGLRGEIPSPITPPAGCRFHTRCPLVIEPCRVEEPLLRELDAGHKAACHVASPALERGPFDAQREPANHGKEE